LSLLLAAMMFSTSLLPATGTSSFTNMGLLATMETPSVFGTRLPTDTKEISKSDSKALEMDTGSFASYTAENAFTFKAQLPPMTPLSLNGIPFHKQTLSGDSYLLVKILKALLLSLATDTMLN